MLVNNPLLDLTTIKYLLIFSLKLNCFEKVWCPEVISWSFKLFINKFSLVSGLASNAKTEISSTFLPLQFTSKVIVLPETRTFLIDCKPYGDSRSERGCTPNSGWSVGVLQTFLLPRRTPTGFPTRCRGQAPHIYIVN